MKVVHPSFLHHQATLLKKQHLVDSISYIFAKVSIFSDVIKYPTNVENRHNFWTRNGMKVVDPSFFRPRGTLFKTQYLVDPISYIFADISIFLLTSSKIRQILEIVITFEPEMVWKWSTPHFFVLGELFSNKTFGSSLRLYIEVVPEQ